MRRPRFVVFAVASVLMATIGLAIVLFGLDLYVHHRAERSAGLNYRGYRGPVMGSKRPHEVRVAVLGGSTVLGYGIPWNESFPALLEVMLNARDASRPWRVANLGFNSEGVSALRPTLEDFAYLDFDIAVFYVSYNDLTGDASPNQAVMRRRSALFRLTGYYPILPEYLRERAMLLRYGSLEAAYQAVRRDGARRLVFQANLAARVSAAALETASHVSDSLGNQLQRWQGEEHPGGPTGDAGCTHPWIHYCDAIHDAVLQAIDRGAHVIVASQPLLLDPRAQDSQRHALGDMMARQFPDDSRVRYLDLAEAVDVRDRRLSFDTMHLNLDGNRVIASALLESVRSLAPPLP